MQSLRVRLLGELQVDGIEPQALRRRQQRTLLKVLALHHGRPVSTDRLAECLWGDETPTRAADQISVLVSRLRGVVGAERITRTDAGYTLTLDWLDIDALATYADEAERRLAQEPTRLASIRTVAAAGTVAWSAARCWRTSATRGGRPVNRPPHSRRSVVCAT